jgi:hypothetical protein
MATTVLHKADTRGHADHWMVANSCFIFASCSRKSSAEPRVFCDERRFQPAQPPPYKQRPVEGIWHHKATGNTEILKKWRCAG